MSKEYNDNYFLSRAKNRNHLAYKNDIKFLKDYLPAINSILDYGCGEMYFTNYLKNISSSIYVYDPSLTIQEKSEYGSTYIKHNDEFEYDAICLRGVIQHLPTPFLTLSRLIKKNLKKNGYLIFLATPNTFSPYYLLNRTLPPLKSELNFWVPSTVELKKVMRNYGMNHLKTLYPYLKSGYANPVKDHFNFLKNTLGFKSNYPFWFSIFNSIFQKIN